MMTRSERFGWSSARPLALATLLACLGCGPSAPRVVLTVGAGTRPLSDLKRLSLVAQVCGEDRAVLRANLPITLSQPSSVDLDAAIEPGKTFYLWLQGWQSCVPAATGCVPEAQAKPGDCTCVDGEAGGQILLREACSSWMHAAADDTTSVTLTLGDVAGLCPPAALTDCTKLK